MESKIEKLTPEIAMEILDNHNPKNRSVSENTVQSYATDMRNGKWQMTHQGLAFDVNGNLLDGQHRLWAIVFAGVPVEMMVTRNLPVETKQGFTMDAIDRNRVRTAGQQMSLCHNIKNGTTVAAALRFIVLMSAPSGGRRRLSTASSLIMYDRYGKDVEALIDITTSTAWRQSFILGPIAMYHHGEPQRAKEFMQQLVSMEHMHQSVTAFRKYTDAQSQLNTNDSVPLVLANAILAFHENKQPKKYQDNPAGKEFLLGMFPSQIKQIQELVAPCRVSITNRKKRIK